MRTLMIAVLGACLLGLTVGCGKSQRVEMPANPEPLPTGKVINEHKALGPGSAGTTDQGPAITSPKGLKKAGGAGTP